MFLFPFLPTIFLSPIPGKLIAMRKLVPSLVTILSLLIAGLAGMGYVGEFSWGIERQASGPWAPVRVYFIATGNGRIHLQYVKREVGRFYIGGGFQMNRPTRDWLIGFEEIGRKQIWKRGYDWYLLRFPIWCILLPCSIAPLLGLRKRRRVKQRGFPLVPSGVGL